MKEKNKNILIDLGNFLGYSSAIGLTIANSYLMYLIMKKGRLEVPHYLAEPNIVILLTEIGVFGGIGTFLAYKLVKTLRDKYKL